MIVPWQWYSTVCWNLVNSMRPRRNWHHFADDIFKCILLNENEWIRNSLKVVSKVRINNIPALVQIMAWCPPGDKPLSEPMMVSLLMHICVTWSQWIERNTRPCSIHAAKIMPADLPVMQGAIESAGKVLTQFVKTILWPAWYIFHRQKWIIQYFCMTTIWPISVFWHNETRTKWQPFCWWQFKMHFLESKVELTKFVPKDLICDKRILVQVMVWCCQAKHHYQNPNLPKLWNHMVLLGFNE